jgi:hypothetical protein
MIMLAFQLISGVVIDKLFNPQRLSTPILDKLHWWGGRLSVLGGIINVYLGLGLFNVLFEATNIWFIVVSIWFVVVVGCFAIAQRLVS